MSNDSSNDVVPPGSPCQLVQTLKMIVELFPKGDDVCQIILIICTQALQCNKTHFYSFLLTSHLLVCVILLNKEGEKRSIEW